MTFLPLTVCQHLLDKSIDQIIISVDNFQTEFVVVVVFVVVVFVVVVVV